MDIRRTIGPLALGLLIGAGVTAVAADGMREPPVAAVIAEKPDPVRCGAEVESDAWLTMRDVRYGIEFQYPPAYQVSEQRGGFLVTPTDPSDPASVSLEWVSGSPGKLATEDMSFAAWKIRDRQSYALASPLYSDSGASLWAKYLFIRNFRPGAAPSAQNMMQATVRTTYQDPAILAARDAGDISMDVLTVPEQILSTFRFLQNEEFPQKD